MQFTRFVCDYCKKDVAAEERIKILAYAGQSQTQIPTDLDGMDYCQSCFSKVLRLIVFANPPEEPVVPAPILEAEEAPEPERIELPKEEEPKHAPISEKKKKLQSLNEELKEEARRRYRAGEEMLDIAKEMNCYPYVISNLIQDEGLGKERYAGQKIPSNGSAPIPTCTVMGGTGKAKER